MKKKYLTPLSQVILLEAEQMLASSISTGVDKNDNDANVGGDGDDALSGTHGWDSSNWSK